MKSSLYSYVLKLLAGTGGYRRLDFTHRKAEEKRSTDTSDYALLIPVTSTQPHTEQFYYGDKTYKLIARGDMAPHLRIDDTYHSQYSEYMHRQYLSFCHGTEHFRAEPGGDMIEARYHFDRTGECVRIVYTSSTTGQQISGIDLQDRADIYAKQLKIFLNKKNGEYLRIQTAIATKLAEIDHVHSDIKEMLRLINEIIELAQQRAALEDHPTDNPKIPLITLLEQRRNLLMTASTEVTAPAMPAVEDKATTQVVTKTPTKAEAHKTEKPSAKSGQAAETQANILTKEIEKCKTSLRELNSLRNKGITASNVQDYVENLENAYEQLLMLPECDATNKLWKILDLLPSAMQLFEKAITSGDLDMAQALFPYCKDRVSEKFYIDLFSHWIVNDANDSLIAKKRAVFDYLFQKCDIFKSCLELMETTHVRVTNDSLLSWLCMAAGKSNKHAFEALLTYGFSPNGPWLYNSATNEALAGLQFITFIDDEDFKKFALNLLRQYGLDPRYEFTPDHAPRNIQEKTKSQLATKLAIKIDEFKHCVRSISKEFHPLTEYCKDVRYVTPELLDLLLEKSSVHDLLDSLVQYVVYAAGNHFDSQSSVPSIQTHLFGDRIQRTDGPFACLHIVIENAAQLAHMNAVLTELRSRRAVIPFDRTTLLEMQAQAHAFAATKKNDQAARVYLALALYSLTSQQELTVNNVTDIINNLTLAAEHMLKTNPGNNPALILERQKFVYTITLLAMGILTAYGQKIDDRLITSLQTIFPTLQPGSAKHVIDKLRLLKLTAIQEKLSPGAQHASSTTLGRRPGQ